MRTKILFSTLLAAIFLAVQVLAVGAAPVTQETTPITGIVVSITVLDPNPETGVVEIVLDDGTGGTQTVSLSLAEAINQGFVVKDEFTGMPVADVTLIDTKVEIDPAIVLGGEQEEKEHPVGSALADFFSNSLGVEYGTVMDYHDDGVGFGVIAQALWMTNALDGNSEMFSLILDAKQTKNFSLIELPDGSEPQNWGQFRKAVMNDREKSKENLGAVMSTKDDTEADETQTLVDSTQEAGAPEELGAPEEDNDGEQINNGNDKDKDKSNNGKNKDKDKNKDKNNGKKKDK